MPLPQPPSVDLGLEVVPVERLLAENAELIGRIKICYGRDRAAFDREVLEVIRRYASFVNAVPATADNLFSDLAGLFRLGLEVGFYSLQGSDSYIVNGKASISTRRILEPRWRFGCFLGGLVSELHRTLNQVIVTDEAGAPWPQYLGPLTPWLDERGSRRLFIRWLKDRPENRATSLFALAHVFPADTMAYLSADNSIVVPHMLACVSGIPMPGEPNAITEVVRRASAAVLNRETESNVRRFGRQIHGAHLERYLIDAMRQLVASSPAWQPNADRSRVWLGKEGLFVVWPNAAEDMRKLLEDDEIPGIPRTADTIREILEAAGFFDPLPAGGNLWLITPPNAQQPLGAVRVSAAALLTLRDAPPSNEQLPNLLRPIAPPLSVPVPAATVSPPRAPPPTLRKPGIASAQASLPLEVSASAADPCPIAGGPVVSATESDVASLPAAGDEPPPRLALNAPFTLDNVVREALQDAVGALATGNQTAMAAVTDHGVFVSLSVLRERNVDVRAALRSMGESGIVAGELGMAAITTHPLAGESTQGVTILPAYVNGWATPTESSPAKQRPC